MIIKNYADKMRDEMMSIELNDNVASSDIKEVLESMGEVLESMGKIIQKSYAIDDVKMSAIASRQTVTDILIRSL